MESRKDPERMGIWKMVEEAVPHPLERILTSP
jgi:hypothetical protein